METYGYPRAAAAIFGATYLGGTVLLAELIGTSADPTAAFTAHFENDASRFGDITGSLLLLFAAISLVALALSMRHELQSATPSFSLDFATGLAMLASAILVASGAVLLTAPLVQSLGDVTGDPGLEPGSAAGIAQAGIVLLACSAMLLGAWSIFVARLARRSQQLGAWMLAAGWVAGLLCLAGLSGAALFPLGAWWLAVSVRWRARPQVGAAGG